MVETKHELIIRFIKNLKIGTKVSVRQIAKELDVSEGTAYRAIKDAERMNLVSSIPKVGTIRIEDASEKELEDLSLREISLIVEAEVLSGWDKLGMVPDQFVIGSTSSEVIDRLIEKQCLVIVGNIDEIQLLALEKKTALLVTGGFGVAPEIIAKAQEGNIPLLTCPFDTFVATSMINRAVYERLTTKELVRVEDIYNSNAFYLSPENTVAHWHELAQETGHSRFPVVDKNNVVVGIVSAVDVAGIDSETSLLSVMTPDVLTAEPKTLVSHLSRLLVWEGFELVPVIDEDKHLLGVVSRQDILKAFQQTQRQPQVGETIDNITLSGFKLGEWDGGVKLDGEITEFMVSELGTASIGTVVMIMNTAAFIAIRKSLRWDTVTENFNISQMNPPSVGDKVEVLTRILYTGKKTCTVEIELFVGEELKAKAMTTARVVKK